MDVDLEIGGNDQTFNMLAGRELIKKMKNKEKFVLTLKLLTDPKGKKMGKTEGNIVNLDERPGNMYGKIMAWPDSLMSLGFELLTDIPMDEINKFLTQIEKGEINPRDLKAKLAKEVVILCHNKEAAQMAEKEFKRIFREKKLPTRMPEIQIKENSLNILDLLLKTKLVSSKSEAKRLILQKAVEINNQLKEDWRENIKIKKGMVIQVGKRRFAKINYSKS